MPPTVYNALIMHDGMTSCRGAPTAVFYPPPPKKLPKTPQQDPGVKFAQSQEVNPTLSTNCYNSRLRDVY